MAGGASSVRAGRAFVELYLNDNQFKRALDSAQGKLRSFATVMAASGAAIAAGGLAAYAVLDGLESAATDRAVGFKRMADRLGDTTENLSALTYAASTTGLTLRDLEGFFENFGERVHQAVQGTGEAATAFRLLNIDAKQLALQRPTQQLLTLADAMNKFVGNDTQRRGILSSLGSDQAQALNKLMKLGSNRISQLMDDAKAFGLVVTSEQAQKAEDVTYAYHQMFAAIEGVTLSIGYALVPSQEFMDTWVQGVRLAAIAIRKWIDDNGDLIQTIELGVYASLGLAGAFVAVSAAAMVFEAAIGALMLPLTAVRGLVVMLAPLVTGVVGIMGGAWTGLAFTFTTGSGAMTAAWAAFVTAYTTGKGLVIAGIGLVSAAKTAAVALWGAAVTSMGAIWTAFTTIHRGGAATVAVGSAVVGLAKAGLAAIWGLASATMSVAWLGFQAAFLVGKIAVLGGLALIKAAVLALPAAILGLAIYWAAFSDSGKATLKGFSDSIGSTFGAAFANVKEGWGQVVSAIGRGDFAGAFAAGTAVMQTEWARFIVASTEQWNAFKSNTVDVWGEATDSLASLWIDFAAEAEAILIDLETFYTDTLSGTVNAIVEVFTTAGSMISDFIDGAAEAIVEFGRIAGGILDGIGETISWLAQGFAAIAEYAGYTSEAAAPTPPEPVTEPAGPTDAQRSAAARKEALERDRQLQQEAVRGQSATEAANRQKAREADLASARAGLTAAQSGQGQVFQAQNEKAFVATIAGYLNQGVQFLESNRKAQLGGDSSALVGLQQTIRSSMASFANTQSFGPQSINQQLSALNKIGENTADQARAAERSAESLKRLEQLFADRDALKFGSD